MRPHNSTPPDLATIPGSWSHAFKKERGELSTSVPPRMPPELRREVLDDAIDATLELLYILANGPLQELPLGGAKKLLLQTAHNLREAQDQFD